MDVLGGPGEHQPGHWGPECQPSSRVADIVLRKGSMALGMAFPEGEVECFASDPAQGGAPCEVALSFGFQKPLKGQRAGSRFLKQGLGADCPLGWVS